MVLLSLQQWGMLVGTIVRPVPVDKDHVTLTNTQISDKDYIDVASVSRPTSSSTSLVGSTKKLQQDTLLTSSISQILGAKLLESRSYMSCRRLRALNFRSISSVLLLARLASSLSPPTYSSPSSSSLSTPAPPTPGTRCAAERVDLSYPMRLPDPPVGPICRTGVLREARHSTSSMHTRQLNIFPSGNVLENVRQKCYVLAAFTRPMPVIFGHFRVFW